jgi:hypothetical protein
MNEYAAQTQPVAQKFGLNLRTAHRTVEFTMTYQGIATETFIVERPATLGKLIRHYQELPVKNKIAFEFVGVKEESLPFGLNRTRQTVVLPNLEVAIRYLKKTIDLPVA